MNRREMILCAAATPIAAALPAPAATAWFLNNPPPLVHYPYEWRLPDGRRVTEWQGDGWVHRKVHT